MLVWAKKRDICLFSQQELFGMCAFLPRDGVHFASKVCYLNSQFLSFSYYHIVTRTSHIYIYIYKTLNIP